MESLSLHYLFAKYKTPFYVTDRTNIFQVLHKNAFGYVTLQQKLLKDGTLKVLPGGWVILQEEASKDKWLYVDPTFLRFNV